MAIRRSVSLALAASLCGALCGCALSGFGWRGPDQSHLNNSSSVASYSQKKQESSLGSGLKSTTDKIAAAFTIKPRVTPADDPIKLTSKLEPVGPEVFVSAARLYENRGDFEAAAGQYRKALEVSPKSLPALVGYARLQDRQNKFEEATKHYKKAIAAHPKSATAHNDLGLCQARQGQPEAALESMQRAVALEPANKLYRNNIASLLVDMARSKEALEHLALAHGEAVGHYNLGYLLFQRDRTEQAHQQFTLAIEKDPSLSAAREMLNRTGGLAQNPPAVRKTQHLAEGAPVQGAETSSAWSTKNAVSDSATAIENPFARRPAGKSLANRVQSLVETQPEVSVSAADVPKHAFPPIRLPSVPVAGEDEDAQPAPLPEDDAGVSPSDEPRPLPGGLDE